MWETFIVIVGFGAVADLIRRRIRELWHKRRVPQTVAALRRGETVRIRCDARFRNAGGQRHRARLVVHAEGAFLSTVDGTVSNVQLAPPAPMSRSSLSARCCCATWPGDSLRSYCQPEMTACSRPWRAPSHAEGACSASLDSRVTNTSPANVPGHSTSVLSRTSRYSPAHDDHPFRSYSPPCWIGGAWLVWQDVREHKGIAWIGGGVIALGLYGFVATLQPDAHFGRVLAAYGGIFVAGSIAWGVIADGYRPDRFDVTGALICLVGMAVIMYAPRSH